MFTSDKKRMEEILKLDLDKLTKSQLNKVLTDINRMMRLHNNGLGPELKDERLQFKNMVDLKPKILTLLKAPIPKQNLVKEAKDFLKQQ